MPDVRPRRVEPGNDLIEMRRELKTQAARNAHLELEHLKKLLSAQEAAKQQAQAMAALMQRQLKSAESDAAKSRVEVKRSQDQLAFARQEHAIELRKAGEREAALKKELIELRAQTAHALNKVSGHRKSWVVMAVVAAGLVLVWAVVTHCTPKGTRESRRPNHRRSPLSRIRQDRSQLKSRRPPPTISQRDWDAWTRRSIRSRASCRRACCEGFEFRTPPAEYQSALSTGTTEK